MKQKHFYEFEYPSGIIDWVFASNKREAIEVVKSWDVDLFEFNIIRVPRSEWKKRYILDINHPEPEEEDYNEEEYSCGYKIMATFEEYARDNDTPDMVATSEF